LTVDKASIILTEELSFAEGRALLDTSGSGVEKGGPMSMARTRHAGSSVKLMATAVIGAGVLAALPASMAGAASSNSTFAAGAVGFLPSSAELTPTAGASGNLAGTSVAVAGSVAVVGSPGANVVDVFDKTSKGWTDVTPTGLTGLDTSAGDEFGASVAISGSELAVGAPMNAGQGAAYIFTKTSKGWNQTGEVIGMDTGAGDTFGQTVALSGSTLAVGAPMNAGQGATYVFTKTSKGWNQTGEFIGGDTTSGDTFGRSIAMSGSEILVGAPHHQVGNNAKQGAAYVFTKGTKGWVQTGELASPDGGVGDRFGISVSIDNTVAVIGAPNHTLVGGSAQGAAYVATKGTKGWSVVLGLAAPDGATNDNFGLAVSLSTSGILVGAQQHAVGGNLQEGDAYLFTKSGTTYNVTGEFLASDGAAGDHVGSAVALSGTVGLVGAPNHAVNGNLAQGVAYVIPG
jgi:hypothetical protein